MKYKTILFDLDGTLLEQDQEKFIEYYFSAFAVHMERHGYDKKVFVDSIWKGIEALVKNDGTRTNEDVFYEAFSKACGRDATKDKHLFDEFYRTGFIFAKQACSANPDAKELIRRLKREGYQLVLATNPMFPRIATCMRAMWAELDFNVFDLITTYEDFHYCKPNPKYYLEILEKLNLDPKDCLLVGNDVDEDYVPANSLGIDVYLVPKCLINKHGLDISNVEQGTFADLIEKLC